MWTRRTFLEALSAGSLATRRVTPRRPSLLSRPDAGQQRPVSPHAEMMREGEGELVIERPLAGRPHAGKVLAAIQPHADDLPLFAAGTIAKLVTEGYTGCLIRMTNDEKAGRDATTGEIVLNNERDNDAVAAALGLTKVFNLNYRNHRMDNESRQEIRGRLIHIFRLMKVDTIVCYDPWAHYEENPDHYVTGQVVESACWMAGFEPRLRRAARGGIEATRRERKVLTSLAARSSSIASSISAAASIGRRSAID